MNRTIKVLLAIACLIVLSYPGIAWLTGIAVESQLQENEQHVLEQVPYLRLVSREYHRGVYRSTEIDTYGLQIPLPRGVKIASGPSLPATAMITVKSNIEHGPFPGLRAAALAIVDSTLTLPPALQQELADVLGSQPLVDVHATIGFLGGATGNLTSPAFTLRLPGGSSLTWGGLTSSVVISRNQGRWSGQLNAPRLAFAAPQCGFELLGLEYSGSQEQTFSDLYAGTGILTVEHIDGSSTRSGGHFSLQRLALTTASKVDGEFLDMRLDAATDAANIASVQLKDLMYSESLEHLHGPSLASMVQALRVAERQAGVNHAHWQAGMHDALRQYGVELLLHDPVIDIRQVSFAMPEGRFLFSARISAPGLARADLQWPVAIAALRAHAQVTADLRVDNGLLQKLIALGGSNPKVGAQLTSFEQQGYLTAGPAAISTHVVFSGGRLTLNGRPFPPAPMH